MKPVVHRWFPGTLKQKMIAALFTVGFLPYFFILVYLYNFGEARMVHDELRVQHTRLHRIKEQMQKHLETLEKEVHFLASLDIMNDMVVEDIDKRILHVLLKKKADMDGEIDLFATDRNGKVIASTRPHTSKAQYVPLEAAAVKAAAEKKGYMLTKKEAIMIAPLYDRMQSNTQTGYLVLQYSLEHLRQFLRTEEGVHGLLYRDDTKEVIGALPQGVALDRFKDQKGDHITEHTLVVYEKLEGVLSAFTLLHVIDKTAALSFLHTFLLYLWLLFIAGTVLIGVLSVWIGKRIIQPIEALSTATRTIVSTQDYTTQVDVRSEGEIARLAEDFNMMVQETNRVLDALEAENRIRLQRFVKLVNIINGLIRSQSEEASIDYAIRELRSFMPQYGFDFSREMPRTDAPMMLYVTDFEEKEQHFYGVIEVDAPVPYDKNEEQFFRSVATMIMLQIDQIRLIAKTKEVSQAKSLFISLMSHELRTPLHTILSNTQYLIGYENLTEKQQEMVATVESAAGHLLQMITDILDLVKIESGKMEVKPVLYDGERLSILIKESVEMLEVLAEEKGLTIIHACHTDNTVNVQIDPNLFRQIMINLLSNAIKFTSEGEIRLTCEVTENAFNIKITDTGIGLDAEELGMLFNDFVQTESGKQGKIRGSGLGLTISRRLAALFGAQVLLESEGRGRGVTATVILRT